MTPITRALAVGAVLVVISGVCLPNIPTDVVPDSSSTSTPVGSAQTERVPRAEVEEVRASRAVVRPTLPRPVTGTNFRGTWGVWDRLAQCESGGNWADDTGNGYFGGLQFSLDSWRAVGGQGNPAHASKAEQITRAERLLAIQGWGAWPACSSALGLR